jgi:hypothetical protein
MGTLAFRWRYSRCLGFFRSDAFYALFLEGYMDISKKLSAELPELKKRIKSISGKTLEASSEQLV